QSPGARIRRGDAGPRDRQGVAVEGGLFPFRRQALAPHLEDPENLVQSPKDAPRPACWAPMPVSLGMRSAWLVDRLTQARADDVESAGRAVPPAEMALRSMFH